MRSDVYECHDDTDSSGDTLRWPAQLLPCSAFAALECPRTRHPHHDHRLLLIAFEWTADLFGGVTVSNTVEELERMDARSAAARAEHWGFMLCRAPAASALALKATAWERGMPRVALRQGRTKRAREDGE